MIADPARPARIAADPAIAAVGSALGLTSSTPRAVHERLLPLLADDVDFARILRTQLDAARASILGEAKARG